MTIKTTEFKRCYLVKMEGRLDSNTSGSLHEAFKSLSNKKHYKFVFDMEDVDFMSSKGWWVLIETQKVCKDKRGELVLANVQEKILSSLDLVGMSHYFKVFDDVVSAVGQF